MGYIRISAFSLGICGECEEPLVVPDELGMSQVIGKMRCRCGAVVTADSLGMKRFGDGYRKVRWVHRDGANALRPVWRGAEPFAGFQLRSWWVVPRCPIRNGKPVAPQSIIVVCQKWYFVLCGNEYPGGFSIHRTMRERDCYAEEYMSKHNLGGPEMFRPDGEPYFGVVSVEMFRNINSQQHGYHSDTAGEECPAPALRDICEGESVYRISA